MKCIEFEGQTVVLGPPPGAPRGSCGGLPIVLFAGGRSMSSFWRPSPEDLAALMAGAQIRLDVHGGAHPPVMLSVDRVVELP